jgi:hypothetical protein
VLVVALLLMIVGVVLAVVGWLGRTERLPRNRFAGVRTPATLRGDEEFRVANKVAGLPIMVGGGVGVLGGGAALLLPDTGGALLSAILGTAGLLAITLAAGVLGHRVAQAMPDRGRR